jgi:hypothetical protein
MYLQSKKLNIQPFKVRMAGKKVMCVFINVVHLRIHTKKAIALSSNCE